MRRAGDDLSNKNAVHALQVRIAWLFLNWAASKYLNYPGWSMACRTHVMPCSVASFAEAATCLWCPARKQ